MYEYRARIVRVYDGDTVYADIDLGFKHTMHEVSLRLYGIDAPELTGPERPQGIIARDALRGMVDQAMVTIHTFKPTKDAFPSADRTEKYGRYLAVIFLGGVNINDWMVEKGHAVPYMVGPTP